MQIKFAVEESDYRIKAYKRIHVAGCRDLRDPEIVSIDSTVADRKMALVDALVGYGSAEDLSELDMFLAPCARVLLGS